MDRDVLLDRDLAVRQLIRSATVVQPDVRATTIQGPASRGPF